MHVHNICSMRIHVGNDAGVFQVGALHLVPSLDENKIIRDHSSVGNIGPAPRGF